MDLKKNYSCLNNNKRLLRKSISIDKNYQRIIEEYNDDLYKIVICKCHSYIGDWSINNDNITFDGKSEIQITYRNENNELMNCEFVEEYSEKYILDGSLNDGFVIPRLKDKYCNCRIINQRKIDFHISFDIEFDLYERISIPCIESCDDSRLLNSTINELQIDNSFITKINFDEELSINCSNGIKRVISFFNLYNVIDSKAIKDKLFVKIKVKSLFLYTNDEEKLEKFEYEFDVSKICETNGILDNSQCFIKINEGCIYAKAKCSGAGDKIEIYGDIFANICTTSNKETQLILDGYVLGHETKCHYNTYLSYNDFETISDNCNNRLSVKLNKAIKEILNLSVRNIDICYLDNMLNVVFLVEIIYLCTDDTIEFSTQTVTVDNKINKTGFMINTNVNSYDYNIVNDEAININVNYELNGFIYNSSDITVLSDIDCNNELISTSTFTLYFCDENERLWDIAKKFSSDVNLIKSENIITGDTVGNEKILIVSGI